MEISSLNCYFVAFHRLIIGKGRSRESQLVNQILVEDFTIRQMLPWYKLLQVSSHLWFV